MERQRRRQAVQAVEPELAPAQPALPEPVPAIVRVVSGAFDESLEVAGMTVEAIARMLAPELGPDGLVHALVDGRRVSRTHRVAAGETLELTPIVGEKGAA